MMTPAEVLGPLVSLGELISPSREISGDPQRSFFYRFFLSLCSFARFSSVSSL